MRVSSELRSISQLTTALRDARMACRLTQSELSMRTGLTRSWINQFECGRIPNAGLSKVLVLCRALNVSLTASYSVEDTSNGGAPASGGTSVSPKGKADVIGPNEMEHGENFVDRRMTRSSAMSMTSVRELADSSVIRNAADAIGDESLARMLRSSRLAHTVGLWNRDDETHGEDQKA